MMQWRRKKAVEDVAAIEAAQPCREDAAAAGADIYEGTVQLQITPFESFRQIKRYTKYISSLDNVKMVSESWSEEDGFVITATLEVPLPLERLLRDMPGVLQVHANGKKTAHRKDLKRIVVEIKRPASEPDSSPG